MRYRLQMMCKDGSKSPWSPAVFNVILGIIMTTDYCSSKASNIDLATIRIKQETEASNE